AVSARSATVLKEATSRARRAAVSISRSAGTTSLTRPRSWAALASIDSPSNRRMARGPGPRSGKQAAATGGKAASLISGKPNVGSSAAITRSQSSAISAPPPSADAWMAAIVSGPRSSSSRAFSRTSITIASSRLAAGSATSTPAEKARGRALARRTTRIEDRSHCRSASLSWRSVSVSSTFSGGRSRVMRATPSWTPTVTGTDGDSGAGTVGNATCGQSPRRGKNLVRWVYAKVSALRAIGGRRGGILSILRRPAQGSARPGRDHRWNGPIQEEPGDQPRPGRAALAHSRPRSLVRGGAGQGAGLLRRDRRSARDWYRARPDGGGRDAGDSARSRWTRAVGLLRLRCLSHRKKTYATGRLIRSSPQAAAG